MRRPAAMVTMPPCRAVTSAPHMTRAVKIRTDFRVPMRSMISPPISTMMMFGKL
jgi:hypothetical protein